MSESAPMALAKAEPGAGATWAARGALAGAVLLALGLEARVWLRSPSADHYAAATAAVRHGFQPGDVVAVAPAFALRPLEQLGDLPGVGTASARAGLVFGASRLWVVADPAADHDLSAMRAHYPALETTSFGPLQVVLFKIAERPLWSAAASLKEAEVRLFKASGPAEGLPCQEPLLRVPGFSCPREPDWLRTSLEWMDLGGTASGGERAIWAHPPGGQDRKTVTWHNVPLQGRLRLGGSHTEYGARSARGPAHVALMAGERILGEWDFPPHLGWTTHDVSVPADAGPTGDLRVVLSAADNAANHFAFLLGALP